MANTATGLITLGRLRPCLGTGSRYGRRGANGEGYLAAAAYVYPTGRAALLQVGAGRVARAPRAYWACGAERAAGTGVGSGPGKGRRNRSALRLPGYKSWRPRSCGS